MQRQPTWRHYLRILAAAAGCIMEFWHSAASIDGHLSSLVACHCTYLYLFNLFVYLADKLSLSLSLSPLFQHYVRLWSAFLFCRRVKITRNNEETRQTVRQSDMQYHEHTHAEQLDVECISQRALNQKPFQDHAYHYVHCSVFCVVSSRMS